MNGFSMTLGSKKIPDKTMAEIIKENNAESPAFSESSYSMASRVEFPINEITIERFTVAFLKQEVEELKKENIGLSSRIRMLEGLISPQIPANMQAIVKNMLKPRGDPFDPSQYSWHPTSEELDNLQKILEEDY